MLNKIETAGQWCLDRLPLYLLYAALFLAIVGISAQSAMRKGREMERDKVIKKLYAENAIKAEALESLTRELARKCWPIWEEYDHETVARKD